MHAPEGRDQEKWGCQSDSQSMFIKVEVQPYLVAGSGLLWKKPRQVSLCRSPAILTYSGFVLAAEYGSTQSNCCLYCYCNWLTAAFAGGWPQNSAVHTHLTFSMLAPLSFLAILAHYPLFGKQISAIYMVVNDPNHACGYEVACVRSKYSPQAYCRQAKETNPFGQMLCFHETIVSYSMPIFSLVIHKISYPVSSHYCSPTHF